MDDLIKISVCGEVNPYDFVRLCTKGDFETVRPTYFGKLQRDYAHLLDCGCCMDGLEGALSEFAIGNTKFRSGTFHANTTYIEQSIKQGKA
jgi:hypothetical protein